MQKELELIKFTLTPSMALILLRYNNIKKELLEITKLYNLDKNKGLLLKILELQDELSQLKFKFIKEFRTTNKEQIQEFLNVKDQF